MVNSGVGPFSSSASEPAERGDFFFSSFASAALMKDGMIVSGVLADLRVLVSDVDFSRTNEMDEAKLIPRLDIRELVVGTLLSDGESCGNFVSIPGMPNLMPPPPSVGFFGVVVVVVDG